jgi:hypothetical protein
MSAEAPESGLAETPSVPSRSEPHPPGSMRTKRHDGSPRLDAQRDQSPVARR